MSSLRHVRMRRIRGSGAQRPAREAGFHFVTQEQNKPGPSASLLNLFKPLYMLDVTGNLQFVHGYVRNPFAQQADQLE